MYPCLRVARGWPWAGFQVFDSGTSGLTADPTIRTPTTAVHRCHGGHSGEGGGGWNVLVAEMRVQDRSTRGRTMDRVAAFPFVVK